jgi:hypothetical protein
LSAVIWTAAVLLLIVAVWRRRFGRRRGGVGSATAGAFYDFLNRDKQNAIEIVVEERAGARDPEDRDGNLPELEKPR